MKLTVQILGYAPHADINQIVTRKFYFKRVSPCEKCKYIAGTRQHLQRHVKEVHEGILSDHEADSSENFLVP